MTKREINCVFNQRITFSTQLEKIKELKLNRLVFVKPEMEMVQAHSQE